MRISDVDRERVVEELGRHLAAGRLDLDGYEARVAEALAAETLADLDHARRDLPYMRAPAPGAGPAEDAGGSHRRWRARVVVLLAAVMVAAAVVLALSAQVVWLGLLVAGWLVGLVQGRAARSRR